MSQVFISNHSSPALNLAFEEHLLHACNSGSPPAPVLFIYRNSSAVVIGRNQNPWLEADLAFLENHDIPILRRISGGGTVYHDPGNTNFTVIAPRQSAERGDHTKLASKALVALGIAHEVTDRNDILMAGQKVSGSAYMYKGNLLLQHATMLVHSDLQALHCCLSSTTTSTCAIQAESIPNVTELSVKTHAVRSRRARAANLPEGTVRLQEAFEQELIRAFSEWAGPAQVTILDHGRLAIPLVTELMKKNAERDWLFGRTPTFSCRITISEPSGTSTWELNSRHGCINNLTCALPENPTPPAIDAVHNALAYCFPGLIHA